MPDSYDPIMRLGAQRAMADALDIMRQLDTKEGCAPVASMLIRARNEAAEALTAIVFADLDSEDPKVRDTNRGLQNITKRYDDLVRWTRELLAEGAFDRQEIDEQAREEIRDVIHFGPPDVVEEAEELGLTSGDH